MACRRAEDPAAKRCAAIRAVAPDRACRARATAKLSLRPGGFGQAEQDGFAVKVVGESRCVAGTGDHSGPPAPPPTARDAADSSVAAPICSSRPVSISRPATAAPSKQPHACGGQSCKASPRVSATVPGMWDCSAQEPCAINSRVSSRTKKGLPPLRCHNCALTCPTVRAGSRHRSDHRRDVGRAQTAEGQMLRGRQGSSSGGASVSRYAPISRTLLPVSARARNPSSRTEGSSAHCRSSIATTGVGSAARPAKQRRRTRTPGTPRLLPRRIHGRGRVMVACSSRPASPSSVTGRPVACRTCDHGQYGGAPLPSQHNPAGSCSAPAARPRRAARTAPWSSRYRPRR